MKRSPGRVVSAFALALGAGLAAYLLFPGDPEPRATSPSDTTAESSLPDSIKQELAKKKSDHPALKSFRVFEETTDDGTHVRGVNYSATVSPKGLTYKADTLTFQVGGATLEQGGATQTLPEGPVSQTQPGRSEIDRGILIERYIFENSRVEQLFEIPRRLGPGGLTLRLDVDSSLDGDVEQISKDQLGWKNPNYAQGALLFKDKEGDNRLAYHSPIAIDAKGRRFRFDPRFENGQIVLDIPASFVEQAEFPLTVDPWLELDFSASGGGISLNDDVSTQPAIAVVGGNPVVAWSDDRSGNFEIYVRFWNGFEWIDFAGSSSGTGISSNSGKSVNPSIALAPFSGDVYVAWQDDSGGPIQIYVRVFNGTTWIELEEELTDLNGDIFTVKSASGQGISRTNGVSSNPSIAVTHVDTIDVFDAFGTSIFREAPVVAWEDNTIGTSEIWCRFYFPRNLPFAPDGTPDIGWSPLSIDTVSGSPGMASQRPVLVTNTAPSLAVPRLPVVVYEDTENGYFEVFGRRYVFTGGGANPMLGFNQPPGSWDPIDSGMPEAISGNAATDAALNPSVSIQSNGDIWVAWQEDNGANFDVWARELPLGTSLGPRENVSQTTGFDSINPAIAVSLGGVPSVAWSDDLNGNPEVYVRQRIGVGNWVSLGALPGGGSAARIPAGVNDNPGGISNTPNLSLFPAIGVDGGGEPVVAWLDGANDDFEIFLKKFYQNEPRLPGQTRNPIPHLIAGTDNINPAADIIAPGGFTSNAEVYLHSRLFSEDGATPLRLQVEVRPKESAFTGVPTLESIEVPHNAIATIVFSGAVNVEYHWRARSVDQFGRASAWISAGGNADGVIDFEVSVPAIPPPVPFNLAQFMLDSVTPVPTPPAFTTEDSIVVQAELLAAFQGQRVMLEVEVRPATGPLSPFQGIATIDNGQFLVAPTIGAGTIVQIILPSMTNGSYHWQAQMVTDDGTRSGWVPFPGAIDFIINVAIPPPSIPTTLLQFEGDGTTPINQGGTSGTADVALEGDIISPGGGVLVAFEVEVRLVGSPFSGFATGSSGFIDPAASPPPQINTVYPPGTYHWRGRTISNAGGQSAWVSFGGSDGTPDFIVPSGAVVTVPIPKKDKCGATGLEALLALGLAGALLRRRRRTNR